MAAGNTVELETIQRLEKRIVQLEEMLAVHRRNALRRTGEQIADATASYESTVSRFLQGMQTMVAGRLVLTGDSLRTNEAGEVVPAGPGPRLMTALNSATAGEPVYVRVGEPPPRSSPRSQPPPPPPRRR